MKNPRKTKVRYETSIVDGVLYFEDARQCGVDDDNFKDIIGDGYTNSIRLVSLTDLYSVRMVYQNGAIVDEKVNVEMTLRREVRSGRGHWYAYRRVFGTLKKRYVGTDDNVTQKRLLEVAVAMPST